MDNFGKRYWHGVISGKWHLWNSASSLELPMMYLQEKICRNRVHQKIQMSTLQWKANIGACFVSMQVSSSERHYTWQHKALQELTAIVDGAKDKRSKELFQVPHKCWYNIEHENVETPFTIITRQHKWLWCHIGPSRKNRIPSRHRQGWNVVCSPAKNIMVIELMVPLDREKQYMFKSKKCSGLGKQLK